MTIFLSFLVLLSKKKKPNFRLQLISLPISLLSARVGPADTSKAHVKFLHTQSVWVRADEAIQEGKNKTKARFEFSVTEPSPAQAVLEKCLFM